MAVALRRRVDRQRARGRGCGRAASTRAVKPLSSIYVFCSRKSASSGSLVSGGFIMFVSHGKTALQLFFAAQDVGFHGPQWRIQNLRSFFVRQTVLATKHDGGAFRGT